ncbi:NAD(P)/FAD-dependent oxidoreductase [Nitrospirillum sp. BR 11164]|uniref:NAD(P)/FAD-dependent oxidoreductase n=1 Tax=Nitrospirillum sp. BR 11164 TaxID=3104324 RepID=UPI002AFEF512|nr:NAD(P)/FAD-dependent oxidoreductase [Nitrospirillum sp. BR 11164]MEA1647451.1 NAD(P)/FAD-dependent oxidoreductase [Nitrospirillum sp. BR 11164]
MAGADTDFDAIVVGAGAVGLACGRALALRGLTVAVLEAEDAIGQGVSSRNSEVAHGGLYYPTGSLRARFCVAGRRMLYPFLEAHGVTYDKCGKLVVATEEAEVPRLEGILHQAQINGVEGMRWLSAAEVHALEPDLRAVAALISPESGIFDSHGYMVALRGEIEGRDGAVVTGTPVLGATPLEGGGYAVRTGGRDPTTVTTRLLVTAPGLSAQDVAAGIEGFPADLIPRAHYGKGSYFALNGRAPFKRLVYPPPIPGALGVHYRRDLGGQARFGPDLEYVEAPDHRVDPSRADGFYRYIRRFWPGLPDGALVPDYAGVRPKIHGPGEAQPDFRLDGQAVHGLPGLVALFGIESPGLTSSLAIGEAVADLLGA